MNKTVKKIERIVRLKTDKATAQVKKLEQAFRTGHKLNRALNKINNNLKKSNNNISMRAQASKSKALSDLKSSSLGSNSTAPIKNSNNSIIKVAHNGWLKTEKSVNTLIAYISDPKKEADRKVIEDGADLNNDEIANLNQRWGIDDTDSKKNERKAVHMIYSLPSNYSPKDDNTCNDFEYALTDALSDIHPNRKSLFCIHRDKNNLHAHILIRTRSNVDNKQLAINRRDGDQVNSYSLEQLQDLMDQKMIDNGFNVDILGREKAQANRSIESAEVKEYKSRLAKLPNYMHSVAPKFCADYKNNTFKELTLDPTNTTKLRSAGLDNIGIKRFANLYQESPKVAINVLHKNAKLLGVNNIKLDKNLTKVKVFNERGAEVKREYNNSNKKVVSKKQSSNAETRINKQQDHMEK